MEWENGLTLSLKEKEFNWKYSKSDGLVIIRALKKGNHITEFSNRNSGY